MNAASEFASPNVRSWHHSEFDSDQTRIWPTLCVPMICPLLCFLWVTAAVGDSMPANFILAGEGGDPFRLGLVDSCNQPFIEQQASGAASGPHFWRALDFTNDGQQILGVSDDELFLVDSINGFQLLGEIGFSAGHRFWFMECLDGVDQFSFADPGAVGPVVWNLRATVVLNDVSGEFISEFDVEYSGILFDGSQLGVLVNETFEEPGIISTQLLLSITDDGEAELEFLGLSGGDDASVDGVLTVLTPNALGAEPVPLPISGLTVAPDGTIFALSEAEWDPFGETALYELNVSGAGVLAEYVSTPDAQGISAIELADDGRLFGAGDSLYLIDPITGASAQIASLAGAHAVDLDYDATGRLYAMARQMDGSTALLDITPNDPAAAPVTQFASVQYWGFVILNDDPADLDGDGDVDGDDMTLFDAAFTGGLDGPFVPAGAPEPPITTLAVPHVTSHLGCPDYSISDPSSESLYRMDATDVGSPGVIVEGLPTDRSDTSVEFFLAHSDDALQISIQVVDDQPSDQVGEDVVELYFDTNNSDSPNREGNVHGFQATKSSVGPDGGDPAALGAWCANPQVVYQPGYRLRFTIDKAAANMVTGGTYGFDVAVRDTDDAPGDFVRYFFFSDDVGGEQDESQWGQIFLAPGPLPAQAADPLPNSGSNGVDFDAVLSWGNAAEVVESRVYLGGDSMDLVYQGATTSSSFDPGGLSSGATYYWRVDQVSSNGVRRGLTWRFTTAPSAADVDRDGDVDEHDARRLFQRPPGDATGDGVIDGADYALIVAANGSMMGDPEYDAAVDYNGDGSVTAADLGIWQCQSVQSGNLPISDFDGDGDEDNDDLIIFTDCLLGPTVTADSACAATDLNLDNHVELRDVALLQQILGGL